jgi:hypothetical protein
MNFFLKKIIFVLCFSLLFNLEAATQPPSETPTSPVKKGIRRQLSSTTDFSLVFPDIAQQNEQICKIFNAEVNKLRELITQTDESQRLRHLVIFDCHGTLTKEKVPDDHEHPYPKLTDLYHELCALKATVVISSAWDDMPRVLQSVGAAGIRRAEVVTTEIVDDYEIVHAGNVVGARNATRLPFEGNLFCKKREAGIRFASQHGIKEINSLTLFDDQDTNIHAFMDVGEGELFGVRYPKPKGILVPDSGFFPDIGSVAVGDRAGNSNI